MFYSNALTFNNFLSQQGSTPYQASQNYSHYNGRFVFTPSYFPFYQPQSDVHPPNLAVTGIEGGPNSPQTVASSKRPRQRRDWTDTETSLLRELYETAYSLGKLTSKTTKANSDGWENLEKDFNRELASRNMAPRTLQQMKEKINNLKSDHKKIKDKESQTGQETQAKPFWFDMVDRLLVPRMKSSRRFFLIPVKEDTKIKERPQIERKTRVT